MGKEYSKMALEELEAERQSLSNQMDSAVRKYKEAIHAVSAIIEIKVAEKKVAGMSGPEREAISKALSS